MSWNTRAWWPRKKPRHFGTLDNGHIVATRFDGKVEDCGYSPSGLSVEQLNGLFQSHIGEGYLTLPGREKLTSLFEGPALERLLGLKFTRGEVEMVYNDCQLINEIHGQGAYEGVANATELEILNIAQKLYETANAEPQGPNSASPEAKQ